MKKTLLILTALCIMFMHGIPCTKADASGEELKLTLPMEGSWRPADESQASFAYRLPQFENDSESAVQINRFYQEFFSRDTCISDFDKVSGVDFELTCLDERYVSVVLHWSAEAGQGMSEEITADTFALDGIYTGEKITLSQLLGLEEMNGSQSIDETVWELVWQIVQREMQNAEGDYLGNLTQLDVMKALQPETDFYLDENGNIRFYIQAGVLAGEIAGVLSFPFAPSELLDTLSSGL